MMFLSSLPALFLLASPAPQQSRVRTHLDAAGARVPTTLVGSTSFRAALSPSGGRLEVRGRLQDVPVVGAVSRTWIGRDGTPLFSVTMNHVGPLLHAATPTVSETQALAAVEASGLAGSAGATHARLVIVPGEPHSQLAWRIDPPLDPRTFDNRVFDVDAHTGAVAVAFNRTRSASVEAYPVNPVETPRAQIFELYEVDDTAEFLEGPSFRVRNCTLADPEANCINAPSLTADDNGDFFYPVPDTSIAAKNLQRDDAYAEVSAYYNADRFQAFLASFGDPGLVCSQGETQTTITVNAHDFVDGEPQWFDNAFYTGDCDSTIVMGQGSAFDYAWDGEVVLHELGHGITDRQTGPDGSLGGARRDEHSSGRDAGAINEGTSDYFGTVLTGERLMGNYASSTQRDLGTDAACPNAFSGEIHQDGIPWASGLLDITDELGLDFVPVVIDTLGMLPLDVSFDEAAATLEAITRDAFDDDAGDLVHEVMAARGLVDCLRIADIEDVAPTLWMYPASWGNNFSPVRPPPYEWRFEVPPNATRMTVTMDEDGFNPDGGDPLWSFDIVLKPDEPIIFTYEDATGVTYVTADSSEQHTFVDGSFSRDVEGGEVLYAAVFNRWTAPVLISNIVVEYELDETGTGSSGDIGGTDASAGDSSGDDSTGDPTLPPMSTTGSSGVGDTDDGSGADSVDDGCSCRADSPRGGAGALLMLGLLGVLRRRRA